MEKRLHGLWHKAQEYVTHWSVAGAILAVTGAAPEHWFAELIQETHFPHGALPPWLEHVDYRLVAVIAGLSIIVGDNLWRHHGSRVAATPETAIPYLPPESHVGPTLPNKPSIAVLPFTNMSGDSDQEYFSDGIAEDIITQLSKSHAMFVTARNSSFTYKSRTTDVRTVGRELGVRYVLEGSVRKYSNRVRVTAQLIEAETSNHVWGERYDRELTDVFVVQDDITAIVSAALLPALEHTERERVIRRPPNNLDAWECYHRGMWHFSRTDAKNNLKARTFFESAIDLDPNFAIAHAGVAETFIAEATVFAGLSQRQELIPKAIEHARRSIVANRMEAHGHATLSQAFRLMGRLQEAKIEAELAVSLDPNSALAYGAHGCAIAWYGQPHEGIALLETAMRLSPFDPQMSLWLNHTARAYYFVGDYELALTTAQRLLRSFPENRAGYRTIIVALGQTGQSQQAQAVLSEALQRFGETFREPMDMHPPELRQQEYDQMLDGYRKAGVMD